MGDHSNKSEKIKIKMSIISVVSRFMPGNKCFCGLALSIVINFLLTIVARITVIIEED